MEKYDYTDPVEDDEQMSLDEELSYLDKKAAELKVKTLERFEREYETDRYDHWEKKSVVMFATVAATYGAYQYLTDDVTYDYFLDSVDSSVLTLTPKEAVSETEDDEAEL